MLGSKGKRYQFLKLLFLLLITGFSEALPILIIVPFITLISYPEKILEIKFISSLNGFLNLEKPKELILPFFIFFVLLIIINSLLRISTIRFSNNLKASFGHELNKLTYKKIIYSDYEYYIKTTSSKILNDFAESIRRCVEIISLFIDGIANIITLIFLIITLLIISKEVTFILFGFVGLTYIFIALVQNKAVKREGRNLTSAKHQQTEIIQETLGSKKDIILKNNQTLFINEFSETSYKTEFSIANINNAGQLPKYIVESLFIILLGSIAYILKINFEIDPLAILGSLALGIQRLLPAASRIFQVFTGISGRIGT